MKLQQLLESKFRGDIRFRGAAYLKAERVSITRVTAERLLASVRDGTDYRIQLTRTEGDLQLQCDCKGDLETAAEVKCKHVWATILAVDEGRYLTGAAKPGYVPPFVVEGEPFSLDEADFAVLPEDDEDEEPRLTSQRPPALTPKPKEWESRLIALRSNLAGEPTNTTPRKPREIYYEIDLKASREQDGLLIQTVQRERRANGDWGKLKPLKLRGGNVDAIEESRDQQILSYLGGGRPDRANWYVQQADTQGSTFRYRLTPEMGELVLPLMAEAGRLRLSGTGVSGTAIAWDGGEPWECSLQVEMDGDAESWQVGGSLFRGDESLNVADCLLVVSGGFLVTDTSVARLSGTLTTPWISLLSDGVEVPKEDAELLVDRLLDLPDLPRLELPEELQLDEVTGEPTPELRIHSPQAGRWKRQHVVGQVIFNYLSVPVRAATRQWAVVQRDQRRYILRDEAAEASLWDQLVEAGFRRVVDARRPADDVEISAQELGPSVRHLMDAGWSVQASDVAVRRPGEWQFQVRSGIDWFELHGSVDFGGVSVAFPEILSAIKRGDTTIRLDDGSLGILADEWQEQFDLLAGLGETEDEHLKFQNNQATLLDALLSTQTQVDYDNTFLELRDRLRDFQGIDDATEPEGFDGELRPYQRSGLGWLSFLQQFHLGGCLADDMGLGKTVQLLALLQEFYRTQPDAAPSLIVVPKSLLFNWCQESQRFTPSLKVLEYTGLDREKLRPEFDSVQLILTTYGTLRRDVLELKETPFAYVVLDEAQAIKNAGSQVAKSVRLLNAKFRLALSGTPIENNLGDLWSIFEFLNPGMLGRSSLFRINTSDTAGDDARHALARGLRPFILRRTKRQVASELPQKFEQTIYCRMGEEQQRIYDELRDHYRNSLMGLVQEKGLNQTRMHVLEALLRLRQVACHPALIDKVSREKGGAKLDALCPQLEELIDEGHKALVFSQFTSMLSIVREHLDKRGIRYEYLDGQTRNRKEPVDRFQTDPDCGVFLISLKAGGLGLNLTAADYVFLLDPWWNPAVETQAIDRAHRVGQTRQVFAYRLICRDTVEEKIVELQAQKRRLAEEILLTDGSLLKDLTSEDIEMLLS